MDGDIIEPLQGRYVYVSLGDNILQSHGKAVPSTRLHQTHLRGQERISIRTNPNSGLLYKGLVEQQIEADLSSTPESTLARLTKYDLMS
ncbi:hypothetical protein OUZ56_006821 [Daphnia magna]|uniref:Uncharacterized protein n=1 Tax=Daphnia magna TaxID=35525 RepID=A0ABQ9YWW7_9CRUS|nr:hypothetical protein OUZ56_006821 [Daphnia magna]